MNERLAFRLQSSGSSIQAPVFFTTSVALMNVIKQLCFVCTDYLQVVVEK